MYVFDVRQHAGLASTGCWRMTRWRVIDGAARRTGRRATCPGHLEKAVGARESSGESSDDVTASGFRCGAAPMQAVGTAPMSSSTAFSFDGGATPGRRNSRVKRRSGPAGTQSWQNVVLRSDTNVRLESVNRFFFVTCNIVVGSNVARYFCCQGIWCIVLQMLAFCHSSVSVVCLTSVSVQTQVALVMRALDTDHAQPRTGHQIWS